MAVARNSRVLLFLIPTGAGCTPLRGPPTAIPETRWVTRYVYAQNWRQLTALQWDTDLCPDDETCAENCALDGAKYEETYGVTTDGDALSLTFVTGDNIGSRLYLMEDESTYQMFDLLGKEFTFDVDDSQLPCGLNGALYFSSMDADGGKSRFDGNKAGAEYGTGYCDSQCPRDLKFINGMVSS